MVITNAWSQLSCAQIEDPNTGGFRHDCSRTASEEPAMGKHLRNSLANPCWLRTWG